MLLQHAAGDTCAGISGWIRAIIILARVHDDGRAIAIEETANAAQYATPAVVHCHLRAAVRRDDEVLHVTEVRAHRVLESMLPSCWIPVSARRVERAFARSQGVDMDAVEAGRKMLESTRGDEAVPRFAQRQRAELATTLIAHHGARAAGGRAFARGGRCTRRGARGRAPGECEDDEQVWSNAHEEFSLRCEGVD